jgi:hypothetical protein
MDFLRFFFKMIGLYIFQIIVLLIAGAILTAFAYFGGLLGVIAFLVLAFWVASKMGDLSDWQKDPS